MRTFAKTPVVLSLLGFVVLVSQPLAAQEFSDAQNEVWRNVERYWDLDAARDLDNLMTYFHKDYLGWNNLNPMPLNKAETRKWSENDFKTTKVLYQNIRPLMIKLHGDVAVVHYYFTRTVRDAQGRQTNLQGRWTDILTPQGDKWVKIADHGGPETTAKQ